MYSEIPLAAVFSIDPIDTYLLTNNDPAGDTTPIILSDNSINAGYKIIFHLFGNWDNGPDTFNNTIGIFSGSASLLASSNLNRVMDAIDAGIDEPTPNTFNGNLSTDVPEDFLITDGLTIIVPTGATHFFSARDSLYFDNSDPNNNYALSLQLAPIPTAIWLFGSGLLDLVGFLDPRHNQID